MINLKRKYIFLCGLTIILFGLFLYRVDFIINGKTTTGNVVKFVKVPFGKYGQTHEAPLIKFYTEKHEVTFRGEIDMAVKKGEAVPIIYLPHEPLECRVYSFLGFWLTPIIFTLFPIMMLGAIVFSYMNSKDILSINVFKLKMKLLNVSSE